MPEYGVAYREFMPDLRLRELVQKYYQVSENHTPSEEEHRFLPEQSVRLTFSSHSSWVGSPLNTGLELLLEAALHGLTLLPQRVVSPGLTRSLGVELYPWGARQLFDWSFGKGTVTLSESHPWLSRAVCALVRLEAWDEARQMVEDWLLSLLNERGRESGTGVQAATRLYSSLGAARISTLASELGLSQRQLERHFLREVGVNAKTLARLIRFEALHTRLSQSPQTSLALLTYETGFADQAHLTREFRALAHMTPAAFARLAQARTAWQQAQQYD
jgi:AraC-like DNA-binding protein